MATYNPDTVAGAVVLEVNNPQMANKIRVSLQLTTGVPTNCILSIGLYDA